METKRDFPCHNTQSSQSKWLQHILSHNLSFWLTNLLLYQNTEPHFMSFNKRAGRKGQRETHKWNNRLATVGLSIGYCVCLCGEIIKWKDSMNLKKHMLTMRSSWGNLRLLWLVLYLFMRVCVPLVGVGALIDTAWPEDHETEACRTLLNFTFSLLSSLLVSIHLRLLSHTWSFGTTFGWHCDQESQCYQNSMRAEHKKNIYGLLCCHLPLIPPFSSLKP